MVPGSAARLFFHGDRAVRADDAAHRAGDAQGLVGHLRGVVPLRGDAVGRETQDLFRAYGHAQAAPLADQLVDGNFRHKAIPPKIEFQK